MTKHDELCETKQDERLEERLDAKLYEKNGENVGGLHRVTVCGTPDDYSTGCNGL